MLAPISEYLGRVNAIKYADILEFDRKLREFPDFPDTDIPVHLSKSFLPRRVMWRRHKDIREWKIFSVDAIIIHYVQQPFD